MSQNFVVHGRQDVLNFGGKIRLNDKLRNELVACGDVHQDDPLIDLCHQKLLQLSTDSIHHFVPCDVALGKLHTAHPHTVDCFENDRPPSKWWRHVASGIRPWCFALVCQVWAVLEVKKIYPWDLDFVCELSDAMLAALVYRRRWGCRVCVKVENIQEP